jgi:hypothetical protein
MYEPNPIFAQPENGAVKVWRYMDFTKLVSLIDTRHLFFSRADLLGDPFEGSLPRRSVHVRKHLVENFDLPTEKQQVLAEKLEKMYESNKLFPKYHAVNCWHMNNHESAAMWKLYLKSEEGIAVQSTYEKLRESFTDVEKVYLGVVKYIDYETEAIELGNFLAPFVHKRKSFEHEREVRALVINFPIGEGGLDFALEPISQGLQIKVDLERLVERIYVAPSAPDWFADLVRALIHRYGYKFEVLHSKLDEQPLF